jgi:hypothetical protein
MVRTAVIRWSLNRLEVAALKDSALRAGSASRLVEGSRDQALRVVTQILYALAPVAGPFMTHVLADG